MRPMFAIVAVNVPLSASGTRPGRGLFPERPFPGPVFHYHIPDQLASAVQPGVLAQVPFGNKQAQGLVIALDDESPVKETREISSLLFDEPVLSARQLELGQWMSEYYLTPLIECLRLMLPPGMLRRPRTVFRLHPQAVIPKDLPDDQRAVIELLHRYPALSPNQIARRIGKERTRKALRDLSRRGVIVRSSDLPAPRSRPRRANFVRLTASPPQVAAVRQLLGHKSPQAAVIRALLDEDDPLPAPEYILTRAGATPTTLSTLTQKGWVEKIPPRTLIVISPTARQADLSRAPRQRAVFNLLRERGASPITESELRRITGASASVLRTMEARGLIKRVREPAALRLLLDKDQARRKIVELRGAGAQNRVLDYLLTRPPGEWVWVSWIYAETGCTIADLRALEAHGLIELAEREIWRDPLADERKLPATPPSLTPNQESVWTKIAHHLMTGNTPMTFLLHGVTGSGKTEIYMRAVKATLQQGRKAIVLAPEISLTSQMIRRFIARFPSGLGVIHSALSDGERYDTWRRIRTGQIHLVIGPRSALFAPLDDIGLIVIDEEHDASYKQSDAMPTYHARDVALRLAGIHKATLLLGSATPDLTTYHLAHETPEIHLLELPQRIAGHRQDNSPSPITTAPLPPVRIVDMRHELRVGNRSIFSRHLQREIEHALANQEQVILFLNRRGAFTFVMCRDCGYVIRCPRCDIPLTYHLKSDLLTCHHCSHQQSTPRVCPACRSRRIKHFGVGTQRVEAALHEIAPQARILRWDRDTVRELGHRTLLDRFANHQADVLIGTQMIAKGLDLPLVTLVGVISADTALNLPDFRAAERTFQLLLQVAGRAGRGPRGGQVIVQTYTPGHYAIQTAAHHDYTAFYNHERTFRLQMGYPPFGRLARLIYSAPSPTRCRQAAQALADRLRHEIQRLHLDITLIGPAPCFFARLRGRHRQQIILRSPARATTDVQERCHDDLHRLLAALPLPTGWRLDVDPLDML